MQTAATVRTPVAAAPMAAVARPARAGAFKQIDASSISRASFGRTLKAKALRASRVETRVVVVRAEGSDKVCCCNAHPRACRGRAIDHYRLRWALVPAHCRAHARNGGLMTRRRLLRRWRCHRRRLWQLWGPGSLGGDKAPIALLCLAAGGGDRPGCRLWLRQVDLHAPVRHSARLAQSPSPLPLIKAERRQLLRQYTDVAITLHSARIHQQQSCNL